MITKIISGGQTGADQAGLRVAYDLGIPTGGWAPKGWITSVGPEPRLGTIYGLQENDRKGYTARTYRNVKDSDGTIRLAIDFNSPGEICTLKAIRQYNKPYLDVNLLYPTPIQNASFWIKQNKIQILNIAGNSERFPNYNIFSLAYGYMSTLLKQLM